MAVHTIEEIHAEAERQGRIIDEQKRAEESLTVTAEKPRSRKKKPTAAEIMQRGMDEEAADAQEIARKIMEEAEPKTPLEAAIDRATGFNETPAKTPAKRDWVKEAYECFVKDAKDIDPTDPVKAIEVYFEKNATDELKARCKAEGKDAKGCWKFIEAVARKALHGSSGHIDPAVVYAIAMHWFEDVPKDWDAASAKASASAKATADKSVGKQEKKLAKTAKPKKPAETPSEIKKEKAKAKAAKKRKSKTLAAKQGFFFEMLETPAEGGTEK